MQTQTIATKRAAQDVGQRISVELSDYLKSGFKQRFPEEKTAVYLSKETILKSFEHSDKISGIRFMYGFENADDPESRVLLLMPCNITSMHLSIPNIMVEYKGYLTDKGTWVSLERSWELLYNHTLRFSAYYPHHNYNKIMRGSFIGIRSLLSLLDTEGCVGINFNFGYDDTISDISIKNKPVFEAVNSWGDGLDVFDFTMPCPPTCSPTDPRSVGHHTENISKSYSHPDSLNLNTHFRDEYLLKYNDNGPLVEMYYSVSPAISEKLNAVLDSNSIEGHAHRLQIQDFNNLVNTGNYGEAKIVFERIVKEMMDIYLFQ
ncbi:hypothetical protein [Pedobacter lusitanus]|nr:hypothetical protein [Pedobacter lusitanus]